MAELTAAIIAGPRWWGEPQTDRNGQPVSRENFKERKEQAAREREIMREIVEDLPDGCFVIHGGARGADTLAASLCNERNINTCGVPFFKGYGKAGGYHRNEMMAKLLNGLVPQGYKVKVITVKPQGDWTKGTKMMKDIAEKLGIYVKVVECVDPVDEQDDTEGEEA